MSPREHGIMCVLSVIVALMVTLASSVSAYHDGKRAGRATLARELVESGICEWSIDGQSGVKSLRGVCE